MHWLQYLTVHVMTFIMCNCDEESQCIANQANITGGEYQPTVYSNSFVIRETSYTGPKGCIKECLYHRKCNAVNYQTKSTCELLFTEAGDDKWKRESSFFSEIADWGMVMLIAYGSINCHFCYM